MGRRGGGRSRKVPGYTPMCLLCATRVFPGLSGHVGRPPRRRRRAHSVARGRRERVGGRAVGMLRGGVGRVDGVL